MNTSTASIRREVEACLREMPSINLSEMDAIRLMNRVDTKYLTDMVTLLTVLRRLADAGYRVFEDNGYRMVEYRSVYYDTPQLQMYLDHHNGRLTRQKLRTRQYLSSGLTFLEMKSKNNHGRTHKKRIEIDPELYLTESIDDPDEVSWLDGRLGFDLPSLSPALETLFSRITLVNPQCTERATIDSGIMFRNLRNGTCSPMGPLAVMELKQDGNAPSVMRDILLDCRVKPVRISKYCIGTAMTNHGIRSGRFKYKLMIINKMYA